MRLSIQYQLGLLVLFTVLGALMVVSIATWYNNYSLVVDLRASRLSLTASLKAAQLASALLLLESSVRSLSTRVALQLAVQRYNDLGNNTAENWVRAASDVQPALSASGNGNLLFQAMVLPKNSTGAGGRFSLLNVTADMRGSSEVQLPITYPNGSAVRLGDPGQGYPMAYYPELLYQSVSVNGNGNRSIARIDTSNALGNRSAVLSGPFHVNDTLALLSVTVPILNTTEVSDVLGYMTVLASACTIFEILASPVGLDDSGTALLIGPNEPDNHFLSSDVAGRQMVRATNATAVEDLDVHFVLPPLQNSTRGLRHAKRGPQKPNLPFRIRDYPALREALTRDNHDINNAGSMISSKNEEGYSVSVGYALPQSALCDWTLLVEQSREEAYAPIGRLRNVLLACVFGTAGLVILLVFPIAHFSVRPIRRLREATKKSVDPPGYGSSNSSARSSLAPEREGDGSVAVGADEENLMTEKRVGLARRLIPWSSQVQQKKRAKKEADRRARTFRIPGKVQDGKHLVKDELTDLTETFNEMSDELMMQYERLEQRVEERTRELDLSKKAAEAANESKTLFIANISHELKTPLNGILGMTAVCMQDDDLPRIKRSLGIIYKSGDLLLHLLTDLLTFSKNQIGQQLSLDEKEFRLCDVSAQILSIFEKQATDGKIDLRVVYCGVEGPLGDQEYGPAGTGKVKDMCLWGDQNRILQVIINLVSNSLKFTPAGQAVELRLRCLGEAEPGSNGSLHRSSSSRYNSLRPVGSVAGSFSSKRLAGSEHDPDSNIDTALAINARPSKGRSRVTSNEGSSSPAPKHARTLLFEFEVEDSGPGIPPHLQERVFEPFVQGDVGLSKNFGGTGLGLSICSQLAKLMHGTIRLLSIEGKGSTFTVRIPLKFTQERANSTTSSGRNSLDEPAAGAACHGDSCGHNHHALPTVPVLKGSPLLTAIDRPSNNATSSEGTTAAGNIDSRANTRLVGLSAPFFVPSPVPSVHEPNGVAALEQAVVEASKTGVRVRVLVAEDNQVNQEVVLRMLKLEDIYDVSVAKDGQEAYEMVKESMQQDKLYDLIFMDVQMPNLDGLQSTRLIREMGYSAPIVALTAFAEESNVKECMACGMNFFLAKPIRRPALKHVLKTYCATIPEEDSVSPQEKLSDPMAKA